MEDTEELRRNAIASMSATANPNSNNLNNNNNNSNNNNPSRAKEEGELSSSDDEIPIDSAAQSAGTSATRLVDSNVDSANKRVQGSKVGKCVLMNDPASVGDIQVRTSLKQKNSKRLEMNSVLSKPVNQHTPGWYVPSVENNNLVISFSDDDSGSDSEGYKAEGVSERRGNKLELDESKRHCSSQLESESLRQTANSQMKSMPDKVTLSRIHTFISSKSKIHGSNSRATRPPLVDQVSQKTQNSDSVNKMRGSYEHGSNLCMNPNNSKLEMLRQQIAIRENELRLQLKSVQQSKRRNSGPHQKYNAVPERSDAAKNSRLPSADTKNLVNSEPEKKRLKLDESYQNKFSLDSQQRVLGHATKSVSKSKLASMKNIDCKDNNFVARVQCTNEIPIGKSDQNAGKQHESFDNQISVLPDNLVAAEKYGESPSMPLLEGISSTATKVKLPNSQKNHSGSGADIPTSHSPPDKRATTRLIDPNVLNRSSWGMQVVSTADDETAGLLKMPCTNESNINGLKFSGTFGGHHSTSSTEKSTDLQNEYSEIRPNDRIFKPSSDDILFKCSARVPESMFGMSDEPLINTRPLNCTDQLSLLGHNSVDLQSLVKLEETQDRELEEAQEHRHRCEQEERKTLKAYRDAQRALVEANARCTYLYRRRELFSAKLRAFMMDDSSYLWSSRWQKHAETELNSLDNTNQTAADPIPTLGNQMQAEIDVLNQLGSDSNIHDPDGVAMHASYQLVRGQKLISEPCSELDASMSDILNNKDHGTVDGVYTPSSHTNMSGDEDEDMLLLDHRTAQSKLPSEDEENFGKREVTINDKPEILSSTDGAQDSALLEASLRSKLFAKLGTKTMSKNIKPHTREGITSNECSERLTEDEKSHSSKGNEPYAVDGQKRPSSIGGEACSSSAIGSSMPSSAVKVAFSLISPTSCSGFQSQVPCTKEILNEEDSTLGFSESIGFLGEHLIVDSRSGSEGGMGSYTCDLSIDPFWPVCMFELRGKCNDEECQWQHVKNYSKRNIKHCHHCAASAEWDAGSLSCPEKFSCVHKLSKCRRHHIISVSPTYLVGLDLLKHEIHASRPIFARTIGLSSQKGFSTSSAVPFSVRKNMLQDVPFFHDSDGRLWGHGSWIRQSSYFQSQDSAKKQLKHGLADPEQTMEVALVLVNEEFGKKEGKKKALSMLSRALEDDPTSVALWIIYLCIYYNENTIGKEDMFFHAVNNSEDSYELWLMYIISRIQLDDRLCAYDSALSALCRHACSSDRDKVFSSACILDLFLQMMEFFCMSGNVGKAIQRICGLLPIATDVTEHGSVLLSDILTCLTESDKCIFWICCVYLVMYRKLPEKVVEQFEFEKELPFGIEWPSAQLTTEEKHKALKLLNMGVDSVMLSLDGGGASRITHLFAVSHVQCVAVLEGIESSENLLDRYIIQHPSCVELVLISARLQVNCYGVSGLKRFEDVLRHWPSETPGIQCIWNQYVQCALQSGETNLAKELMVRWFQSVWKVNFPHSGKFSDRDGNCLHDLLESCSFSRKVACISSYSKDELFGLLNLSLHRLLEKDQAEARLAIDKALMVASSEDFKHCVKEHATFVLSYLPKPMEDALVSGLLNLLNSYLLDARFVPVTEPLSRRFSKNIRRPRIRQLINKILGPASSDFSLINAVFEACYGPSLLPGNFGEVKNLVDFVEPLMEMFPANYRLAMSVCNAVTSKSKSDSVASAGVMFWASSLLVNSIYQAFPVAPEYAWVEVAEILNKQVEVQGISESFHRQALLVYPFSTKLWKSYYNLAKTTGNLTMVMEISRERGIKLD